LGILLFDGVWYSMTDGRWAAFMGSLSWDVVIAAENAAISCYATIPVVLQRYLIIIYK